MPSIESLSSPTSSLICLQGRIVSQSHIIYARKIVAEIFVRFIRPQSCGRLYVSDDWAAAGGGVAANTASNESLEMSSQNFRFILCFKFL